jgi:hypothetical protein
MAGLGVAYEQALYQIALASSNSRDRLSPTMLVKLPRRGAFARLREIFTGLVPPATK